MKRRSLLGTLATASFAGCLSEGGSSEKIEYDRCTEPFIPISQLPDEARREVDTVLEEGTFETEESLSYPQIVGENSILWDDESERSRYYEHFSTEDKIWILPTGTSSLLLETVTPALDSPAKLTVSNQTAESVTVEISVSDRSGNVLSRDELSANPVDDITEIDTLSSASYIGELDVAKQLPSISFADEFTTYNISVAVSNGQQKSDTFSLDPDFFRYWVQITDDEITMGNIRDVNFMEHIPTDRTSYCYSTWHGPVP